MPVGYYFIAVYVGQFRRNQVGFWVLASGLSISTTRAYLIGWYAVSGYLLVYHRLSWIAACYWRPIDCQDGRCCEGHAVWD